MLPQNVFGDNFQLQPYSHHAREALVSEASTLRDQTLASDEENRRSLSDMEDEHTERTMPFFRPEPNSANPLIPSSGYSGHQGGGPRDEEGLSQSRQASSLKGLWWPLHTCGWLLSLALFLVVVAVLNLVDKHIQPDWKYGITLNTILSILGIISSFSMMLPISAGLGQLKWIRFQQGPKSLSEFEIIDQASRGPMGSLKMLWHGQGGYTVALGAITTILVVANNPFIQQTIQYEPRSDQDFSRSAYIPVATTCTRIPPQATSTSTVVLLNSQDPSLTDALYNAGFSSGKGDYSITPYCPTSNCSWQDPYWTLGVCSSCSDVGGQLKNRGGSSLTSSVYLPNGLSLPLQGLLNVSNYITNVDLSHTLYESIMYKNTAFKVADFFIIAKGSRTGGSTPAAWECMLQLCALNYKASMENGVFTETLVGQWTNDTQQANHTWVGGFDIWNSDLYFTPPNQSTREIKTLRMSQQSAVQFNLLFDNEFKMPANFAENDATLLNLVKLAAMDKTLPKLTQTIADSINLNIRTSGSFCNALTNHTGTVYVEKNHIHVVWGWIVLPAAIQLLGFIFFATVLMLTRRSEVQAWRVSALPIIFHGLAEGTIREPSNDLDNMEEVAERLVVQLKRSDIGPWKLAKVRTNEVLPRSKWTSSLSSLFTKGRK